MGTRLILWGNIQTAFLSVLAAALLFGTVTPISKMLLSSIGPVMIAGLYYLGAGVGLLAISSLQHLRGRTTTEASLVIRDLPWLMVATICGGIAGPILLMISLKHVPAGTASLLLNAELVMTALVAILCFHEPSDKRTWAAILLIIAAGFILSFNPEGDFGFSVGAVGILLACLCWGIDNNATRVISGKDPIHITVFKGLVAGSSSMGLALLSGEAVPEIGACIIAMGIGFCGYGLSILLFIRSLRVLGAARTGSLYASAPFIGLLASYILLGEVPGVSAIISLPFMIIGVLLIMTESHLHRHAHIMIMHEHRHRHDDLHHTHIHPGAPASLVHSHMHTHQPMVHAHPHTPDLHHHHRHAEEKKELKMNN